MQINGREIRFAYTVGAYLNISDALSKNQNLSLTRSKLIITLEMSKAYCKIHGGEPLKEEEITDLPAYVLEELMEAAEAQRKIDMKQTVEAKEPKGKKGKNAESAAKAG